VSDESRGIAGDRRRNPFPAFSDTEYELFRAQMREEARLGAEAAITAHLGEFCAGHRERTEHLEACVFGRTEKGIVGLDNRVLSLEGTVHTWEDDRKWFKRMLYGALTVATIGLLVAVAQVIVLGK